MSTATSIVHDPAGLVAVKVAVDVADVLASLSDEESWHLANPGSRGRLVFRVALVDAAGRAIGYEQGDDAPRWSEVGLSADSIAALARSLAAHRGDYSSDPDALSAAVTSTWEHPRGPLPY